MNIKRILLVFLVMSGVSLGGCEYDAWNNPYPEEEATANVLYGSFQERPKHLDPARSYSSSEYEFIANIYEPPLQYHFLKRPYQLIPATVKEVPQPRYLDENGEPVDAGETVAYSVYEFEVKPGIRYQPHPAFAKNAAGEYFYHQLTEEEIENKNTLSDFEVTGTRELVAADYVYQVRRLAHPKIHSPIYGLMSNYILELDSLSKAMQQAFDQLPEEMRKLGKLPINDFEFTGAAVLDRYRFQIKLKGQYPQFLYWLAMPFFAPMPWEADAFYLQPGLPEKNITLNWYPIGTGPYMLTENNPNLRMVLEVNPNFHDEFYPAEGEAGDEAKGWLEDAGKKLPLIKRRISVLEKESIPVWTKFLQGYYDLSGVGSDNFDQAVHVSDEGDMQLTKEMRDKGIQLNTAVATSVFYYGFNMLDPVVGGLSEDKKKLRRAIAIAVDWEEFISVFLNGRGLVAQSPLPPGIFGYEEDDYDANIYEKHNGYLKRRSLDEAKTLLAEAGYPNGIDPSTGRQLQIHLDTMGGGPDDQARFNWWMKQFAKLNIELVIRNTDYNRFQDKMFNGNAQFFGWGWNADYPDPENFFFLLYGPNSKVKFHSENAANYESPEFDALFDQMKNMENSPERLEIIRKMIAVLRDDAPWLWGFNPKQFSLYHDWFANTKVHVIANNTLKYRKLDPVRRAEKREQWNKPVVWPVYLVILILLTGLIPAFVMYKRHSRKTEV